MKYWGVALTFAALISVNAEASISSLFHQLLKSVQDSHSIKNEQSAPDGGDEDSADGSSDGSSSSGNGGGSDGSTKFR